MSNVDRLRDLLSGAVDDPDHYFEAIDEDVVWDLRDTASPEAGVYQGARPCGTSTGAGRAPSASGTSRSRIDAGDDVVAFVTEHGQGRGSGAEVEMTRANVTTFRDGKIVGFRSFSDRDAALRYAGLDPGAA